ncbi:MAG: chemotaxis protein CheW, partial [Gemmataceae bacterium]
VSPRPAPSPQSEIKPGLPESSQMLAATQWLTESMTSQPRLEQNDTLIAFRIVVKVPADRGFRDSKVRFPLPPGVKQVHASRRPLARKGWLSWQLGVLPPGDSIPISVKIPRTPETEYLRQQTGQFELSYLPALAAARLEFDCVGPPTLLAGEQFTMRVHLHNAGDELSSAAQLNINELLSNEAGTTLEIEPLSAGERRTVELPLTPVRSGLVEWAIVLISPTAAPIRSSWSADVITPAVTLNLVHPPSVGVDAECEVTIAVENTAKAIARNVQLLFTVPEELAFATAPGGRFDASSSNVSWALTELLPGQSRTLTLRLRGFASGLARLHTIATVDHGNSASAVGNLFCEVSDRGTVNSTLDQLLQALNDTVLDDDLPSTAARSHGLEGDRYLVFELAGTGYAAPISNIREVIRPPAVTPVPFAPEWLMGLANVRGDVVSVVDLTRFLGMDDNNPQRRALLVAQSADGQNIVGLLVDEVAGIRRITAQSIDTAAELGENPVAPYLGGIAELQNRLVPLLDLNRLLSVSELGTLELV